MYTALAYPGALTGSSPLVVDLGFAAFPWTTLEMYARWTALNPALRVTGLEIDPERVAAAQPYADPPRVRFGLGGFNVKDALGGEQARVIRAFNVLRQYDEGAVGGALAAMAEALRPDGLLIEGTSTPSGRLVAFDVYRRNDGVGLAHEALVFGTNFRAHAAPVDFQAILPKRLIHHMRDPGPASFFAAWQRAQALARGAARGRRAEWMATARMLAAAYPVDVRERLTRRGYLAVRAPLR